ncbi:MAG: glucose-1-phosphate adenylyltransferase, partial [Gemmataceae bacterium]|nr:glucose-1-phosphate adenylyltransferase [Gemmataceae bacterium]
FVFTGEGTAGHARRGVALDSIVCAGCIVSGGHVRRSILSPRVRVNSYAVVEDSILLDGVDVGRYCRVRKAIIDKDVKLPPYTVLGYDPEFDRRRGFVVTDTGVVVVPKNEPPETFQSPNPLPN